MNDFFKTILATIHDYWLFNTLLIKDLFDQSTPKEWETGDIGTIVLIPGFNEGLHFLKDIGNLLNKEGYRIIYPKKFGRFKVIEESAIDIQAELASKNIKSFNIIGHSKGGLVAKLMLMNNPQAINKVLTIATPWKGTYGGYLEILNLGELKPNSNLIRKVQAKELNPRIVNIRARFDQYMIKNRDVLEDAKNIQVSTKGHARVLFAEGTKMIILDEF
jgi:pimeloyl-ACP methyl ester carboxylesterase